MNAIETGGPAFPLHAGTPADSIDEQKGMTLRDYFAAHALSGLYTPTIDDGNPLKWKHEALAQAAYMAADAMMIARKS